MRVLIRAFDRLIQRLCGVFEFSRDSACLLRLQFGKAPRTIRLANGEIAHGVPVLLIHLWNEHVPPLPPDGADVAWGLQTYRMLIQSFRAVAQLIACDPRLEGIQAVGGITVLVPLPNDPGGGGLLRRMGFELFPYAGALGRFGEFWENLYTWGLMWTYNAASLRQRQLLRIRRQEMWMTVEAFMRRYG